MYVIAHKPKYLIQKTWHLKKFSNSSFYGLQCVDTGFPRKGSNVTRQLQTALFLFALVSLWWWCYYICPTDSTTENDLRRSHLTGTISSENAKSTSAKCTVLKAAVGFLHFPHQVIPINIQILLAAQPPYAWLNSNWWIEKQFPLARCLQWKHRTICVELPTLFSCAVSKICIKKTVDDGHHVSVSMETSINRRERELSGTRLSWSFPTWFQLVIWELKQLWAVLVDDLHWELDRRDFVDYARPLAIAMVTILGPLIFLSHLAGDGWYYSAVDIVLSQKMVLGFIAQLCGQKAQGVLQDSILSPTNMFQFPIWRNCRLGRCCFWSA